jgi:crossover junction endodeoxyribonuclease RusA
MAQVTFEVVGLPAPQGSKRHVGNGVMIETGRGHRPWRAAVAAAAREHAPDVPLDGPLQLVVHFRFPMPASRPAKVRSVGQAPKTTAPDLDKLIRSVGDALTEGGLIRDDARICALHATKSEVQGWSGAVITIEEAHG